LISISFQPIALDVLDVPAAFERIADQLLVGVDRRVLVAHLLECACHLGELEYTGTRRMPAYTPAPRITRIVTMPRKVAPR